MNPRFTLAFVLLILAGLAGALWYTSSGLNPVVTHAASEAPTPIAVSSAVGGTAADDPPATPAQPTRPGKPAHFVFAISWEPAFCETVSRRPECDSMTATRFDADHFALHGLWPDDDYCSVVDSYVSADKSGRWEDLPAPTVSPVTRAALDKAMPGTQSMLERHEWIKHGTCSGMKADAYFAHALALLAEINASPVRDVFARNIGRSLDQDAIGAAFDDGFGQGARDRVRIACDRDGSRRIITELTIGLYGDVAGGASLASLISSANPTSGGCDSGVVDRVGAQ